MMKLHLQTSYIDFRVEVHEGQMARIALQDGSWWACSADELAAMEGVMRTAREDLQRREYLRQLKAGQEDKDGR